LVEWRREKASQSFGYQGYADTEGRKIPRVADAAALGSRTSLATAVAEKKLLGFIASAAAMQYYGCAATRAEHGGAAIAAYASVKFLVRYFKTKTLTPFAIYCAAIGIISLLLLR